MTKLNLTNVLDGYIRVSQKRGREGETYLSPKLQREAIERWAEYHHVRIARWHVDEDWSGGASSRPGLDAARERVRRGETGGIVAWKIDRFSRNTQQGLADLKLLKEHNARLAFVVEQLDTSTSFGKMMYTILLAVAESFLDGITAGWTSAQMKAFERGALLERTPLGYVRVTDRNSKRVGALDVHPVYGPWIAEAFRIAAESGLDAGRRYLADAFPDRRWETTDARRLFANRAYLGEVKLDGLTRIGHERLTEPEIWAAAQTEPRQRRSDGDYPLSNIAHCEVCGEGMTGQLASWESAGRSRDEHGRWSSTGTPQRRTQRRYRCSNGKCSSVSVNADHLEAHVRAVIDDAMAIDGFEQTFSPEGLVEAREAAERAERHVRRWAEDDATRDAIGELEYSAGLAERREAAVQARSTYEALAAQAAHVEALPSREDLDTPEGFERALAIAVDRIVISRAARGTHPPVAERIAAFDWAGAELETGVTAA